MQLIEFIGIPGVGKSTIRDLFVKAIQKERNEFITSEEAVLKVARKYIDKPIRMLINCTPDFLAQFLLNKFDNRSFWSSNAQNAFLANYGFAFGLFLSSTHFKKLSLDDKISVITGFFKIGGYHQIVASLEHTQYKIFFDEGLVQRVMMFISNHSACYESVNTFLDNIPIPTVIVYARSSPKICLERLLLRPRGLTKRMINLDQSSQLSFLADAASMMDHVVSILDRKTTILEINCDDTIEKSIVRLTHYFTNI